MVEPSRSHAVFDSKTMNGTPVPLPKPALGLVRRIDGVELVVAVGQLADPYAGRRSSRT